MTNNILRRLFTELQEIKKLEEAAKLRRQAIESIPKVQEPVKTVEEKLNEDGDKSDPEIIVDGDSKDKPEPKEGEQNTSTSDAVVVIDDDVKENAPKDPTETPVNNTVTPQEITDKLQQILPVQTPLDEIRSFNEISITKEQIANMVITMSDFEEAVNRIQPSAKREGFATVPDVTWNDVGSLSSIREELQMDILVNTCGYSMHKT